MKNLVVEKLIKELPSIWDEYMSENDWGSGEDIIRVTEKIEQEWYENECLKAGLDLDQTKAVLEGIGF